MIERINTVADILEQALDADGSWMEIASSQEDAILLALCHLRRLQKELERQPK